jgi:exodeoxyribonuclease VII small subunit
MEESKKENKLPEDIKKLNFEEALAQLQKIIESFESGEVSLDKSIDAYKRGIYLKQHCEKKLNEAKLIVEQVDVNEKGEIKLKPFSSEDKI